jgi:2-hydroxychromene-2-carboxylate isomerase
MLPEAPSVATREVDLFFNYRSPYCYLASRRMWQLEDDHGARLVMHPLGGWDGRSPPERVKQKLLVVRQDCARWARRFGMPFVPPPPSTDGSRAAAGALLAAERGVLRPYTIAVMHAIWGEGKDIGDPELLCAAAAPAGLDRAELAAALDDPERHARLAANAALAAERGVFGVPTFVIGSELFWGQDRLDFVAEHLAEIRSDRSRDSNRTPNAT